MEQVKLIAVTVVVTLLIWTTADQLLSETDVMEVTVDPLPAMGTSMIVGTDPPGQNRFKMTLTGPKRAMDQVRREGGLNVTIRIPGDLPSGSRRIDVKEALADYPEQFRGLRVESVDPPEINLLVDHPQTVTMPVRVERGDLDYEVPPTVEPQEVRVTISELALRSLEGRQRVVLDVEDLLRGRPEGLPQRIEGVPLPTRLGGVEVTLEPDTVTVFATLREQVKTGTVAAVPIIVGSSADVFNQYRVETRDGTTLITRAVPVRGPPAVVDRLVNKDIRLTGLIYLTRDLAARADEFRELVPTFDLPPGVRLAGPVSPVVLRLVPREEPGGP
ncbi:MAG TPA: hypothetical protein VM243_06910 [Phycisphaerae bacterium]|nr:hypothetical protein [Phycisphaerae bacterium]